MITTDTTKKTTTTTTMMTSMVTSTTATATTSTSPSSSSSSSSSPSNKNNNNNNSKGKMQQNERPYPWNIFSDEMYLLSGITMLLWFIVPTMSVIFVANVVGFSLKHFLYDNTRLGHVALEGLRSAQRWLFRKIGNVILLDPRDHTYLPWMFWGSVIQPVLFYLAYQRYLTVGYIEVSTFLLYHLLRVGPRHQLFAHHATLVHKEGHATARGLFCNVWDNVLYGRRTPISKFWRRLVFDHVNAGISGVFYGSIANHYATAHRKIHHRWHNDIADVHTNIDMDRTKLMSYIYYLPRFLAYWSGVTPVLLFWCRSEYQLLMDLVGGMTYYYTIHALVWYKMGFTIYWAYFLYPFLENVAFLGLISYLWHSFREPSDPENIFINSITILRGGNNVWNEDYHVVHHTEPHLHWTDYPKSFELHLDKYTKAQAPVFSDCEQGEMLYWMLSCKWDDLTSHFVDLQYVFSDGVPNHDKARRYNCAQVAQFETTKLGSKKTPQQLRHHHERCKAMLLRRMSYQVLVSSEEQSVYFHNKLNDTSGDFEEPKQS